MGMMSITRLITIVITAFYAPWSDLKIVTKCFAATGVNA
jgi:hypothetical protein